MALELVRHTPTQTPPVASRAFAYLAITAYEAAASGDEELQSLAGQLNELMAFPPREAGAEYDEAVVQHAALASTIQNFFGNTGPTGQRAMRAMDDGIGRLLATSVSADVVERSRAYGLAVAEHILQWSLDDGGATIENLGFPYEYTPTEGGQFWRPTNAIRLQQAPLLPGWGDNRPFAMPDGASCPVPDHVPYSETEGVAFYVQAREVYDTVRNLTEEQRTIARFWSDDPMLSPTPPGHWVSIALQVLASEDADLPTTVDTLARLGVALADAFIGCWEAKYQFNLVRPVSYIKRLFDPAWETVLITPPFPEYPSGHSTQSGAAAMVLERLFGKDFAFIDATHEADGLAPRSFTSFRHAAEEAAISRLYGGIHYRMAIDNGLDQGECIGAYANALVTRR
ncbi:vanadium-dependent haloperoxidase [Pelagibacterium limicola]|uniref:vanadium-dependent haloperoxidase n=1 Tax=Pelagibacterium limicola TaxID=2791022 RepID=UPI001FE64FA3|nr:vanadium-dependent haloperoxidase [Pelagibacterium limicola]